MTPLSKQLRRGLIVTATGMLAAGVSVSHANPVDWKAVGGWDVSYYPNSGGCQAYALFEEGAAFFIGFDNNDDVLTLDITALDGRWTDIQDGIEYDIRLKFGDEAPWSLAMDGVVLDGYPGLNIMIDASSDESDLFIDEFQREASMEWSVEGTRLGRYTLSGSRRAFEEVITCQDSYAASVTANADPEITEDSKATDPVLE